MLIKQPQRSQRYHNEHGEVFQKTFLPQDANYQQKKTCLEIVGRLELTERNAKIEWERGRSKWTAAGRNRLHMALKRVTDLIEEILVCEEHNDIHLIEQAQGMA